MSTNADIIVQRPGTQEFTSIYLHWDGYPSWAGKRLLENYNTYEKVISLIQLGDLSELHETLDKTVSYYRWRNEPIKVTVGSDIDDHARMEYSYLFRDNEWWYCKWDGEFQKLTPEVCERD